MKSINSMVANKIGVGLFKNPITSIRVELRMEAVRIGYVHPQNPFEDCCFEIHQGKFDMNIFKDFMSAFFPMNDFNRIKEAEAKKFCQSMYEEIVQSWLKKTSDFFLGKAAAMCALSKV